MGEGGSSTAHHSLSSARLKAYSHRFRAGLLDEIVEDHAGTKASLQHAIHLDHCARTETALGRLEELLEVWLL